MDMMFAFESRHGMEPMLKTGCDAQIVRRGLTEELRGRCPLLQEINEAIAEGEAEEESGVSMSGLWTTLLRFLAPVHTGRSPRNGTPFKKSLQKLSMHMMVSSVRADDHYYHGKIDSILPE